MKKITVLTAVYNAERYLRQCLDSLLRQTFADCQFICIDDCSTDGSLAILREYAAKDNRFLVLHQSCNMGQAVARNRGLELAEGKYVTMLDADDWFSADALEKAYWALEKNAADAAVFRLMQCFEEGGEEEYPIRSAKTYWNGQEAFRLSLDWSLHGLYVVRTDIHMHYPYDTSCRLYSDDNTTLLHYLHSGLVVRCEGVYYYRKHSLSMTNACSVLRFDHLLANLSMKRVLSKECASGQIEQPDAVLNIYERHRWLNVMGCYFYYHQHVDLFNGDERKRIESIFVDVLASIEPYRIPWSLKWKLGYYPFRSYLLFTLSEKLFLMLRRLFRRGRG